MYGHAETLSHPRTTTGNGDSAYHDGLLFRRFSSTVSNHQWDTETASSYREPVIMRHVPFRSPQDPDNSYLRGHAHIAYIPNGRILGASRLIHLIQYAVMKTTNQQTLTVRVSNMIRGAIEPLGLAIVMESPFTEPADYAPVCHGARLVTRHLLGTYREDRDLAYKFLSSLDCAKKPRKRSRTGRRR
jgi:GTP cyclohydrolase I